MHFLIESNLRILDISKLASVIVVYVGKTLVGMHANTDCDNISAFSGQGKLSALELVVNNERFQKAFSDFGQILNCSWFYKSLFVVFIPWSHLFVMCMNYDTNYCGLKRWHWFWTITTTWGMSASTCPESKLPGQNLLMQPRMQRRCMYQFLAIVMVGLWKMTTFP